jgi:hypothetical protein
MKLRALGAVLGMVLTVAAGLAPAPAGASSHSEAPGTAKDRLADDTDLYAFVAKDRPDAVTFVGNWIPLLEPNGGPNFYTFDDDVDYYINVDNVGDAQDHIRYEFEFTTHRRNPNTFLYNTGVVNSINDATLNVYQTYKITRIVNGVETVLADDLPVAPNFVGPVSMPDYKSLANEAVRTLPDGSKVFVGPRDDPFFVDLAAIFDLLTIRKPPGNKGKGVDGVGGFNVMSVVLQVPKRLLTQDGQEANTENGVIGVYDSAERPAVRTINGDGTVMTSGDELQVSRLGMPLVNEVVIPLKDKDKFNATKPTGDGAFLNYVLDPELAKLLTALYGIATPPAPRNDLVAVFLTGIPGLNKPANPSQVPCEMLRLNMTIPPTERPSRFGLLGGDLAGFPNGRRLADDVVDIAERVVAGATAFTPQFNVAPNNQLGDGVNANDRPFLPYFPYVAPPQNPLDHQHHGDGDDDHDDHWGRRGFPGRDAAIGNDPEAQAGSGGPAEFGMRLSGANPASASRLEFSIAEASHVTLKVYDVQGRTIRTLLDQDAAAGSFVARWDGATDSGARAQQGIYFVRLSAGGKTTEKKVVLQ